MMVIDFFFNRDLAQQQTQEVEKFGGEFLDILVLTKFVFFQFFFLFFLFFSFFFFFFFLFFSFFLMVFF